MPIWSAKPVRWVPCSGAWRGWMGSITVSLPCCAIRSDLQKLAGSGLRIPGKDGKREIFRVPADLAARLPG